MAKDVKLTALQRIQIASIIRAQSVAKFSDLELLHDLLKAVQPLSDEERSRIGVKVLPDGRELWSTDGLDKIEPVEVVLENAEWKKLLDLIDQWPGKTVADYDWIKDIRKQLL